MGYNKDLISPSHHDQIHNTNYTITSHTLAHCNINDNIRRNDEREPKDKEKDMQLYPRWNPTPEQMMLLEKVYNGGTRTPTTQQIQEIASMLQMYGRIEGKNVFYWFQNHKSRERLKRRRPDHIQGFVANKDHEEAPLRKEDSSTASRRRGDRRVCLSSSSPTHPPQNNNTDDGKRGIVEEKEATCQNQTKPINIFSDVNCNLIITSKTSQEAEHKYNLNEEEEEETRKNRTLDLFPVIDNQEKTGLAEKNPKQNKMCCNYYYYYEFMPLINCAKTHVKSVEFI